jgi:hypothetical protein
VEIDQGKCYHKAQERAFWPFLKVQDERAERPYQENREKGHPQRMIRDEGRIIFLRKSRQREEEENER